MVGSRPYTLARLLGLASLGALLSASAASGLSITVADGSGRSQASDGTAPTDALQPLSSPPFSAGPIVATDGGSSSSTTYTFTKSSLRIDFSHVRTASGGFASSDDFPAALEFTVDEAVLATVSGAYDVTDTGSGDRVFFELSLAEGPLSTTLHQTTLESRTTANESFAVGAGGGDFESFVDGPTTHLLSPGSVYTLNWIAFIDDFRSDPGDTGATANGFFEVAFVPEPSTGMLLGGALAGLALRRRRSRGARPHTRRG